MSNSDILTSMLTSRTTRTDLVADGIRTIKPMSSDNNSGGQGGIIGFLGGLWDKAIEWGGWIVGGVVKGLQFTFKAAWGLLCQTAQFIWNFNWNATDEELDQHLDNLRNTIASQLGGTLGNLSGYLVCGVAPAAGIMYFNEILGLKLLKEVGEEALDELAGNLSALTRTLFNGGMQQLLIQNFKNVRRLIKWSADIPGVSAILGEKRTRAIKAWGEKGSKPWSFAKAFEEWIDNIESPLLQNFTEEFFDELFDSCQEAGYIIANGLDEWYMKQQASSDVILGDTRIVQLEPNRESDEKIICYGPEKIVKPQLVQAMQNYSLVENRDIGQFMGESVRQVVKKSPALGISIKIQFFAYPSPPFWRGEKKPHPEISIANVDRLKLDWERLKIACGGQNGYTWGRFCATANMIGNDGQWISQMRVWGASESEAENRLKALAELSEYTIASLSVSEQKKIGRYGSGRDLEKESCQVYPAYFTVINSQKIINEDQGYDALAGTYKRRKDRLDLWVSTEPIDYQDRLSELFRIPGPND